MGRLRLSIRGASAKCGLETDRSGYTLTADGCFLGYVHVYEHVHVVSAKIRPLVGWASPP